VGCTTRVLKRIPANEGKPNKGSPRGHMSLKKYFCSSGTINCQYYCIL
jgi:hypothetical protein